MDNWTDEFPVHTEDREFAAFHEIIEHDLEISATEVQAHHRSFERGYRRARRRVRDGPDAAADEDNLLAFRRRRARYWYAAAAVLMLGILTGLYLVNRPGPQPGLLTGRDHVYAVSGIFGNFAQADGDLARVRTSANGRLALPGVTVHHRPPGARQAAILLATTAYAQGTPGGSPTTGDLVFSLDGAEIGSFPAADLASNDKLMYLDLDTPGNLITSGNTIDYPVDLRPGDRQRLADNLEVALDAQSPTGWRGILVHDLNWPGAFRYGNVVEGVLRLNGPATDHLYITMAVSDDKLKLHTDDPAGLTVVVHHQDDPEPDRDESQWFRLDDLPPGSRVRQRNCLGSVIPGGRATTWQAATREDYALYIPLAADGRLVACNTYLNGSTDKPPFRQVTVLGFKRPQSDRWKGWFADPAAGEISTNTALQSPILSVDLDAPHEGRIILGDGVEHTAGTYRAQRTDFIANRTVDYGPVEIECVYPAGSYHLAIDAETGLVILEGDLDRIAGDPVWDADADGVMDGTGFTHTVTVQPLQYRKVAVVFEEINGARLFIHDIVSPPAEDNAGFCDNVPMLLASKTQPAEEVHLLSMTDNCQYPPFPAGTLACNRLIPYIVVEPSAELLNRDLDRLTFTVNGSPAWGNCDNVYFDPYVFPARRVVDADGLVMAGDVDYFKADEHNKLFSFPNASIDALRYIARHANDGWLEQPWRNRLITNSLPSLNSLYSCFNRFDVLDRFERYMSGEEPDMVRWDTFRRAWKIDIADPPSETEVYRLLGDFVANSDFFTMEHLTEPGQQMTFNVDLQGRTHLTAGQYILVSLTTETSGGMTMGQWDVYSGGDNPASITITTVDGYSETWYMDFAAFTAK